MYKSSSLALRIKSKTTQRVVFITSYMVRQTDLSWNTLEQSIVTMYEKLADLGWVIYNGEVHIIEPETEKSKYHV